MKKSLRKITPINNFLIDLPSPSNITLIWNFGSLLGLCLTIQIFTGLFLSIHYSPNINIAFKRIVFICRDVNYGWIIRNIHANGASIFFLFIYIHIRRGIYYGSYKIKKTWISGTLILLTLIATAFIGYVLPWGQISFWGATVITNLISAIPYIGQAIVYWIWGGFSIENPTLNRFFSFHFILPFILIILIIIHLNFLHLTGSSNPLGLKNNNDKIPFHPFFTLKDLIGILIFFILFFILILKTPFLFNDPENFTPANPLVTPIHIQPEWYFLFAYAILRSIPNKLGGVLALVLSILIFASLSFSIKSKFKRCTFYPLNKIIYWIFLSSAILLTWAGARPVEPPFILIRQILTISYFSFFVIFPLTTLYWDKKF